MKTTRWFSTAIVTGAMVLFVGTSSGVAAARTASDTAATTIVPYLSGGWRYQDVSSGTGAGFEAPTFDDSGWTVGQAAFGNGRCDSFGSTVQTNWPLNTDMLLRRTVELPAGASNVTVGVAIDNDVVAYWNGVLIGQNTHEFCASEDSFVYTVPASALSTGANVLAVRGIDRGVFSYLDVSVVADVGGVPSPSVTAIGPVARGQSSGNHLVKIHGSGFQPGAVAAFSGDGITTTSAVVVSPTLLTEKVAIAANATLGRRDVIVTNPDSGAGTCAGCFTVSAAPAIDSVAPGSVARGSTGVALAVTGANFKAGIAARTWGSGVQVVSVARIDLHHVVVTIDVAAGAAVGRSALSLVNRDGGTVTKNGAITVT